MKSWIEAARPRTLPLALSSILMGSILAAHNQVFNWTIFGLAVLTTILLQVMSNFANDYGDTQNGADSPDRVGPARAVQSGEITPSQMKKAIYITGFLAFVAGVILLIKAFWPAHSTYLISFLGFGVLSILAAYFYTAGSRPYGYAGLGDLSVFLFFGLLGVMGTYFLYAKHISFAESLPAVSCGLLAVGVLNLNNIRDINSDKATGKHTIPVRLGKQKAIIYHLSLLTIAAISLITFFVIKGETSWWFLLGFPLLVLNGVKLRQLPNPDPLLKQLSLTSLLIVLLVGLSLLI